MNYLVTGSAGFIGFHACKKLLERGEVVIGIDNFNDYYDVSLKEDRNNILEKFENFKLMRGDISNLDFVKSIFLENKIDKICHLAAQAGVRYSIENPYSYINSNIIGFTNIINEAKNFGVKDFIFASSSSVYGDQEKFPIKESFDTDYPISLYAATKKSNEVIAYSYHHLFGMNCTGLRFFTVYGPWGRPDMATFIFAEAITSGKAIKLFNSGKMKRDFTYIDDIVGGIINALDKSLPFEIFNLSRGDSVDLNKMIELIEMELDKKAIKEMLPMQPGDVLETFSDITLAKEKIGFNPKITLEQGIKSFIFWYKQYKI